MVMKRIVIVFCLVLITSGLYSQGFSLNRPTAIGGNLVAMEQDLASYPAGAPLEEGLSIGPGVEFFLKYDISPKFFFTIATGLNTINHNYTNVDVARTTLLPTLELRGAYKLMAGNQFSPFLQAGAHMFGHTTTVKAANFSATSDRYYDGSLFIGGGAEVKVNENVNFYASGDMRFVVSSDADPQPRYWVAKAGIAYNMGGRSETGGPKDEIEYPLGDDELASLDDLFKDSGSSSDTGMDDLDLLFAPEEQAAAGLTESYDDDNLFGGSSEEGSSDLAYAGPEATQLQDRIEKLRQEMDSGFQQIQALEAKVRANEQVIAGLSGDAASQYAGPAKSRNDASFRQRYDSVLQLVHAKKYKEAISGFSELMAGNPEHKLASNCQYWIGECYNALGDYSKAIQAFSRVMDYRSSYKFDDALIMTGLVNMKLGDNDTAKQKFQELVNRYPDSEYAPKAMRYLGRL